MWKIAIEQTSVGLAHARPNYIPLDFTKKQIAILRTRGSKVVSACIFNKPQAVGLFLAFDGASTLTDHFASGKKVP